MSDAAQHRPFDNDHPSVNVPSYQRPIAERPFDYEANRREIVEYFTARLKKLHVVKTSKTRRGQLIDWIPIESQRPRGEIADPPPTLPAEPDIGTEYPDHDAVPELQAEDIETGPAGTVPILRKRLEALGYEVPLRQYLSKYRGQRVVNVGGMGMLVPGPGSRGTHRFARSGQRAVCFGGEGQFSCFWPYTDSSAEFSLLQIGLSNSDLASLQTVEAGWQAYRDITGDWLPHLYVYYTTNGYAKDVDNQGGYNMDVTGWVQRDSVIFPGTTFTPYSQIGGAQRKIRIKYRLYRDNWWLSCQGRWVGYYPAWLFMGNQSLFSTLGDHADHIGFWGEVASFQASASKTDMGSGRFAEEGWTRAGYFHHLLVQTHRDGTLADYDGSSEVSETDDALYSIDPHFKSGTGWRSYAWVGGPGAG